MVSSQWAITMPMVVQVQINVKIRLPYINVAPFFPFLSDMENYQVFE